MLLLFETMCEIISRTTLEFHIKNEPLAYCSVRLFLSQKMIHGRFFQNYVRDKTKKKKSGYILIGGYILSKEGIARERLLVCKPSLSRKDSQQAKSVNHQSQCHRHVTQVHTNF